METAMAANVFQIFVRLLDNKTLTLQFPVQSPISTELIKQRIESLTQIPSQLQKLTLNGRFIDDQTRISPKLNLSTIHLNFSLLGGKGGFGSLLRGAATKAGQKKTNNFDACRDMSGRRLRHVNAEKKLEEWKAEEEQRKLEKTAEDFLKKMAKTQKKKGGGDGAEKYVQKYREDSARCVEEVERSVKESVGELMVGKKRKLMEKLKAKAAKEGVDAKKLKIWMGKRALNESDSDDTDDDESGSDDAEHERSVVTDNGNQSDSSKELDGTSGVKSAELSDVAGDGLSSESSQEEKDTTNGGSPIPSCSDESPEANGGAKPSLDNEKHKVGQDEEIYAQGAQVTDPVTEAGKEVCAESVVAHLPSLTVSQDLMESETAQAVVGVPEANVDKPAALTEASNGSKVVPEIEDHPINLDNYTSAADLEVVGLEKLKTELQARGLKCGGTLQERAARLFLLKTTPIDKLPKKLLAKK